MNRKQEILDDSYTPVLLADDIAERTDSAAVSTALEGKAPKQVTNDALDAKADAVSTTKALAAKAALGHSAYMQAYCSAIRAAGLRI